MRKAKHAPPKFRDGVTRFVKSSAPTDDHIRCENRRERKEARDDGLCCNRQICAKKHSIK